MMKSLRYCVLFAALLGFGAGPVLAQGKGSRAREEQPRGPKVDRGEGGEARADRSNRAQSKRGSKNDGDKNNSDRDVPSNKRRR